MAATVKILKKVSMQIQAGANYEFAALKRLPLTGGMVKQKFSMIEDSSITGEGFKDLPQQGIQDIEGSFNFQVDQLALSTILEACTGSTGPYVLGANIKKLSIACLDAIAYNKYANMYAKSFKIAGQVGGNILGEIGVAGITGEIRDTVISNYPVDTMFGDTFTFHEMEGASGYFRVGDQADPLAVGDNLQIEDFSLDINVGYDVQHTNQRLSLIPIYGMVPPTVEFSFKIARHNADNFLAFRDADTKLQAEFLIYKSATASLKVQIPNFKIDPEITDDDIAKQQIKCYVGRNGAGTTYKNTNAGMAFVSPVKFTLVNA